MWHLSFITVYEQWNNSHLIAWNHDEKQVSTQNSLLIWNLELVVMSLLVLMFLFKIKKTMLIFLEVPLEKKLILHDSGLIFSNYFCLSNNLIHVIIAVEECGLALLYMLSVLTLLGFLEYQKCRIPDCFSAHGTIRGRLRSCCDVKNI